MKLITFNSGIKGYTVLIFVQVVLVVVNSGCKKDTVQNIENDNRIFITKNTYVDNKVRIHDPKLNLESYEAFLKHISSSDRFLVVTQKEYDNTVAKNKVVISLRHDVDRNMNGAIRMAYREKKYGLKATYFILPTAKFYGSTGYKSFKRNDKVIYYLRKLQDAFGHEVGFHNDLVTLQLVYGLDPKKFLKDELKWLRDNGISISGTSAHGSQFCYIYHYLNTYFWKTSPFVEPKFYNYVSVSQTIMDPTNISYLNDFEDTGSNPNKLFNAEVEPSNSGLPGVQIIKDYKENYDLIYDSDYLVVNPNYNFSDGRMYTGGKRWHMGMEDFDKIPLGQKVIILVHAENWD